jgi:hypothetical protein
MTTADRWRWLACAAALAATLMDLLDSTIANIAAPAIPHRPRWPAQPGTTSSDAPRYGLVGGQDCGAGLSCDDGVRHDVNGVDLRCDGHRPLR